MNRSSSILYTSGLLSLLTVCGSQHTDINEASGKNVTLHCIYETHNSCSIEITWVRCPMNGSNCCEKILISISQIMILRKSDRYQLLADSFSGNVSLSIRDVKENDSGNYACFVETATSFCFQRFTLKIAEGPPTTTQAPVTSTAPTEPQTTTGPPTTTQAPVTSTAPTEPQTTTGPPTTTQAPVTSTAPTEPQTTTGPPTTTQAPVTSTAPTEPQTTTGPPTTTQAPVTSTAPTEPQTTTGPPTTTQAPVTSTAPTEPQTTTGPPTTTQAPVTSTAPTEPQTTTGPPTTTQAPVTSTAPTEPQTTTGPPTTTQAPVTSTAPTEPQTTTGPPTTTQAPVTSTALTEPQTTTGPPTTTQAPVTSTAPTEPQTTTGPPTTTQAPMTSTAPTETTRTLTSTAMDTHAAPVKTDSAAMLPSPVHPASFKGHSPAPTPTSSPWRPIHENTEMLPTASTERKDATHPDFSEKWKDILRLSLWILVPGSAMFLVAVGLIKWRKIKASGSFNLFRQSNAFWQRQLWKKQEIQATYQRNQ
ncbi:uncharacterized protein [Paramormyrops kingsleyae]|uniref:uncharacterized protein isoform X2 n=1 Tax=Paramormyrops kingsleyae TaxID=1676925 RepID=UPI003B976C80